MYEFSGDHIDLFFGMDTKEAFLQFNPSNFGEHYSTGFRVHYEYGVQSPSMFVT